LLLLRNWHRALGSSSLEKSALAQPPLFFSESTLEDVVVLARSSEKDSR
jgi:hypothetical protein